jgi:Mn2+/Fe2+ NRAMP family transporter
VSRSKAKELTLGILTSIGGFVEIGAIATAVEAGAAFRYQLLWTMALGTICLVFLLEMSGRLAATSRHTLADAVRERFGFNFTALPRVIELIINFLVLGAELGGVALAISLVTGVSIRILVLPVALVTWLVLWRGTLGVIENVTSVFGLVTLASIVAMFRMHPAWGEVAHGFVPTLPQKDGAHYWFLAISIFGAIISPYMFYFYSSGAVEDDWDESFLTVNRASSGIGMTFGATLSVALLGCAALAFAPRGITIDKYEQVGLLLTPALGVWGLRLLAISLGVCCFGAAAEVALGSSYMVAQTFGWNWSEDEKPLDNSRFAAVYTVFIFASALLIAAGIDPLKLTMFTMAMTSAVLPVVVLPFMLLLNDEDFVGEHRNGWIGNSVVVLTIILASVMAIITIPLEIMSGG